MSKSAPKSASKPASKPRSTTPYLLGAGVAVSAALLAFVSYTATKPEAPGTGTSRPRRRPRRLRGLPPGSPACLPELERSPGGTRATAWRRAARTRPSC